MRHAISMDPTQISYLGIMSTHHPTFHLEVWFHVLPLPIWIEISPNGGLYLSGRFHSASSLILQLWLLQKVLKILLRLHVER